MTIKQPPVVTGARALPRGIRNHNPGNIRLSDTRWQGQKSFQIDPDFIEFESPVYGLRALMRLLLTYHVKYGLDTVESLINRYAPPVENATDAYIHQVCRALKVARRSVIDVTRSDVMQAVARAIVRHENGSPPAGYPANWYSPALYAQAVKMVLQPEKEKA